MPELQRDLDAARALLARWLVWPGRSEDATQPIEIETAKLLGHTDGCELVEYGVCTCPVGSVTDVRDAKLGAPVIMQVVTWDRKSLAGDVTRGAIQAVPAERLGIIARPWYTGGRRGLLVKWNDDGSLQELNDQDLARLRCDPRGVTS